MASAVAERDGEAVLQAKVLSMWSVLMTKANPEPLLLASVAAFRKMGITKPQELSEASAEALRKMLLPDPEMRRVVARLVMLKIGRVRLVLLVELGFDLAGFAIGSPGAVIHRVMCVAVSLLARCPASLLPCALMPALL